MNRRALRQRLRVPSPKGKQQDFRLEALPPVAVVSREQARVEFQRIKEALATR